MNYKKQFKKIWYFIWEDDSALSWIVNIILAFVIIKFMVYPVLGAVFATSHPIVAVVSGSMEHKVVSPCIDRDNTNPMYCYEYDKNQYEICGNLFTEKQNVNLDFFWNTCGNFYSQIGITKDKFSKFSFNSGFNTGDIMILYGSKPENYNIGDVVVFQTSRPDPIIHRIVMIKQENGKYYYTTKGDHNPGSFSNEINIVEDNVIGKAVLRVPFLGYVKIFAVKVLHYTIEGFRTIIG